MKRILMCGCGGRLEFRRGLKASSFFIQRYRYLKF